MPSERVKALIELLDAHEGDALVADLKEIIQESSVEELKEAGEIMLARVEAARKRATRAAAGVQAINADQPLPTNRASGTRRGLL